MKFFVLTDVRMNKRTRRDNFYTFLKSKIESKQNEFARDSFASKLRRNKSFIVVPRMQIYDPETKEAFRIIYEYVELLLRHINIYGKRHEFPLKLPRRVYSEICSRKRSASMAAMQPEPAAVMA